MAYLLVGICNRRCLVPNSNVYLQPYCRQTKERLKQIPIYREVGKSLPCVKGGFLVHLCLINFPDKHCFCRHKSKIRHTYFEVCRIFIKLSFRVQPYSAVIFIFIKLSFVERSYSAIIFIFKLLSKNRNGLVGANYVYCKIVVPAIRFDY